MAKKDTKRKKQNLVHLQEKNGQKSSGTVFRSYNNEFMSAGIIPVPCCTEAKATKDAGKS